MCSYEPVRFLTLRDGIELIHSYKGVAAVAHPWLCNDPLQVCSEALSYGVDGLECFPPSHREEYGTTQFRDFAHLHNLFCSSGSDFHGINNLEEPFLKERLNSSSMVLRSKTLRLYFKRF